MAEPRPGLLPPLRPEVENTSLESGQIGEVQRPLSTWERITNLDWVRRLAILVVLAVSWELYGRHLQNPLMVPTFSDMVVALWNATVHGPLLERIYTSLRVLLMGYALGVALAAVFTAIAVSRGWAPTCSPPSPRCSTRCRPSRCCRSHSCGWASGSRASSS